MTMKLSEAIMLGDSLKEPTTLAWITTDGKKGCALGGAMLAVGKGKGCIIHEDIMQEWPWLDVFQIKNIINLYDKVYAGSSIEELCDYVRSIEPNDDPIADIPEVEDVECRGILCG